ncbi:hypothetical protein ACDT12_13510, partial [Staphylococcus aureus]
MTIDPIIVKESLSGILTSSKTDDDLQEQLIELLGLDNIELIVEIMSNRKTFLQELQKSNPFTGRRKSTSIPSYGMQVTVQNENQKKLQKSLLKEERKMKKRMEASQKEENRSYHCKGISLR